MIELRLPRAVNWLELALGVPNLAGNELDIEGDRTYVLSFWACSEKVFR